MTRQEFIDDVSGFGDLCEFCWSNECNICEDIVDSYQLDDCVWDDIRSWDGSWEDLSDALNNIDRGYDWYRRNGVLDFERMGDWDFDLYKSEVLEWAEESGVFDDEEEDDGGYWYTDPMTGETLVAGEPIASDMPSVEVFFDF